MLKKYKNELIDIIRKHGLDPADFSVLESKSTQDASRMFIVPDKTTVHFRNSGLRFDILDVPTALHAFGIDYTLFDAGWPLQSDRGPRDYSQVRYPVTEVYHFFDAWLSDEVLPYVDEMKQPDLWQQIEQQKQLVTADPLTEYETSPFTEPEKQQVRASIGQFRILILESFSPTQEQLEVIDQKLDYLTAAADRPINRFDWKSIALSTVIGIVTALSLDTERGRQLFELFKQAFSRVLHLLAAS